MPPELSISIINTNNREMTLQCLQSVFSSTKRVRVEVFVVDNACTDGSAEAISAQFPMVHIIRNDVRLGFSTNNNKALGRATGRYLMILNDDTIVLPGALDTLVEFMDTRPEVGAAGPKVFRSDKSLQPSFDKFPTPVSEILFAFRDERKYDRSVPISADWVGGACMLVRRAAAEQSGLLDTDFDPLYVEETEWCFRIRQAGWQIYHVPDARIIHLGGQTAKLMSTQMTITLYRNKMRFFRKHYPGRVVLIYRFLLLHVIFLQLARWLVLALVSSNRALAWRKIEVYRSVLTACI